MEKDRSKLTTRQQELLAHLNRWQESGLGMKSFAELEGLKVQDLYAAKQVLKRKGVFGEDTGSRPRFARVKIDSAPGVGSSIFRVRLANGCLVEFSCPAEPEAWQALLSAVAALR